MKILRVGENCDGCGLCIMNCDYLQENADGNAEFISGKYIMDSDYENVKNVVAECPCNALEIVENNITNKQGKEGAKEVVAKIKKQIADISVKKQSDLKFDAKNYYISIPYSSKDRIAKYSSESQAKSAARDEFNRLCYSETAYRPILKKIFVEYKVKVLKPYYDSSDKEGNVYYLYNKQARELLKNTYAEITSLIGKKIPESWKDFSVYYSERDWEVKLIAEFDERSTSSGIISALKDLSHTSLSDYVSYMDFDYNEVYAGEGLFGRTKYKNEWYFSDFRGAAKTFIDDLTWAVGYQASDIQEEATKLVDNALKTFEKKLKDELIKKVSELEKYI